MCTPRGQVLLPCVLHGNRAGDSIKTLYVLVRRVMKRFAFLVGATLAYTAPSWAVAEVKVMFTAPEKFADIGYGTSEREETLRRLTQLFESSAARYVPQNQTLNIEVTDVDLAGRQHVSFRRPELRVVKPIDWPSITLRYTLTQDARVIKEGQTRLSDLGFDQRLRQASANEPLYYEKRMLEDWLRKTFDAPAAKAQAQ
jgi:hypothetical protein